MKASVRPSTILHEDSAQLTTTAEWGSAFPGGINVGATWDRGLAYARGAAQGQEYHDMGADVLLRPVVSPLGRFPQEGRLYEGFSADPYLSGEMVGPIIRGVQDNGVIATAKHYLVNEQEHFRQVSEALPNNLTIAESISENVDDRTMHEVYLW